MKKNSSLTTKLITAFIALAVVSYFGVQVWRALTRQQETTPVYIYRAEHVLPLAGRVVRDESVVDCTDALVELRRAEGERVAKGKAIATVYNSEQALEDARELASLRSRLEQLQYAQSAARDAEEALRLDSEIEADIVALHTARASGNYAALEDAADELRSTVLRREYAYRDSADLSERLEELDAQIRAASAAASGKYRTIYAPFAGTFSAVVDGYESVLTPEALHTMTPDEFDAAAPEAISGTAGRLIRGEQWYYAASVPEEDAAALRLRESYELAISGAELSFSVVVYDIGEAVDGRCLLVLRGDSRLASVTLLRTQSAELILESHTGLRVPKNALRIDEKGQTGVYCRIGLQSFFKPVELVYQGEDYCLVRPGGVSAARDSDLVLYTLRAGDEVIVTSGRLYNGKVID